MFSQTPCGSARRLGSPNISPEADMAGLPIEPRSRTAGLFARLNATDRSLREVSNRFARSRT